jgi:hypothetical protein
MVWVAGQSGNPHRNGARPLGSRNRRTTEAIEAIIAAGHQDPLLTLAELQAKSADEGIRATAANMLAPYLHSKCGATPPLRFIAEPVELPHPNPTTVDHVNANLSHINSMVAAGTLDMDFATLLLAGQREHIVSYKAREDTAANTDIHIIGGLPELPGTHITMPHLNGHESLGLLPPNDPPITPEQDPDQPPAIPPENDPPQDEGTSP